MFSRVSEAVREKPAGDLTIVRQRPGVDVSLTGFIYGGIMLFMGVAAAQNLADLLFGIFGLMIGTLVVSGVISRLVVRGLNVRRVMPEHGVVGATMHAVYQITNSKRQWPSLSVTVAELDGVEGFASQPQCYLLHAAAGMTASIPADFNPKRRGLHELNRYQLGTGFPFGFVKLRHHPAHPDRILIYPALAAVDERLIAMCRAAEMTGSTVRPQAGGSDEFYGVKEFRSGENPRWIYWRRSARTGTLVSREMTRVAPPQLLLLVDSCQDEHSLASAEVVERTIAMAASLASAALAEGLSVGLVTWNGAWLALPPGAANSSGQKSSRRWRDSR